LADRFERARDEPNRRAEPSRGHGGLSAGMTTTDDQDIKV
jgi:hypothetical protein